MKKFIARLLIVLRKLGSDFRKFYNGTCKDIIEFLQVLKAVIDSPVADAVVKLTETAKDDRFLQAFRRALSVLFPNADVAKNAPISIKIAKYLEMIQGASPELRAAIILKIGSLMVRELFTGKLSGSEADTLVQLSYKGAKEGQLK